ncbi:hypothetical protein CQW23_09335 [Capsicum baccatum]|uniref:Uncharacterized protein n=1 Tax=Capsicum baccatum TaxID=33114 RepID=A0A2G2WWG3_CAPBA|nr:hypothetical protein CQW23_09335 [Capsicum baccatum]
MVGQTGETVRMGHFEAKLVCYRPRFWGGPRVWGFRRIKIDLGVPGRLASVPVLHVCEEMAIWLVKQAKQCKRGILGLNRCSIVHVSRIGPGVRGCRGPKINSVMPRRLESIPVLPVCLGGAIWLVKQAKWSEWGILGPNWCTIAYGMIPQEIGNLVNLAELAMEINQITGLVPISILNISSVQILSLSMNNFSGFLPQEISNLTKMQNLQLGDNKLIAEIPKEISNLVELEVLDLSGNSFSGSLDMEIFNISGLRVISISNNNLSGSLPPNLCSLLPNIEKLYMNDLTNLVGTFPHSISNCSELTILELSNNQLTGLIPNSLGHLAHLQFLNLERNNLTNDSTLSFLTSLTSCRNLTFLSVYLNPLNGMLPASTGNLSTSLRTFVADICKIKG